MTKGKGKIMMTTGGCGRSDVSKGNEIASQRGTYGAHGGSRMGRILFRRHNIKPECVDKLWGVTSNVTAALVKSTERLAYETESEIIPARNCRL